VHGDRSLAAGAVDLGEAFRRLRNELAATALRALGRRDELDDVLQDVFLEAIRGIHNLRDPSAVGAWLARVTLRMARRRMSRRRLVPLDDVPDATSIADPAASPADRALLGAVAEIMAALPPEGRRAWLLRYRDGEPLEDIAAHCHCSLATVKRRIASVQEALAEMT
jgi:RNA polymerase sigma-70 factor (ECF subfamily)